MNFEKFLKKTLKNLEPEKINQIVEIGFGSGVYSGILREIFPKASITGFESQKVEVFSGDSLSKAIFEDFSQLKLFPPGLFPDLVTMGTIGFGSFEFLFGIDSKDKLKKILLNVDKILLPDKLFLLATKIKKCSNFSQKAFHLAAKFRNEQGDIDDDFQSKTESFDPIKSTQEILSNLDSYSFQILENEDRSAPKTKLLCEAWLQMMVSSGVIPHSRKKMEIAKKIDLESEKNRQEIGWHGILIAKKKSNESST